MPVQPQHPHATVDVIRAMPSCDGEIEWRALDRLAGLRRQNLETVDQGLSQLEMN